MFCSAVWFLNFRRSKECVIIPMYYYIDFIIVCAFFVSVNKMLSIQNESKRK